MDGDRPRLTANRNCYRLSCVSLALAQIFCLTICISAVASICYISFLHMECGQHSITWQWNVPVFCVTLYSM